MVPLNFIIIAFKIITKLGQEWFLNYDENQLLKHFTFF
ncbi:hypothetical protein C723_0296 [Christiangramia flava JLT2011]|uniref:Uncharacterized protein n=1 Tax=Christiangramia flava JLT2011 TaxID=1229726 RepID=A0A1L7I410_9FLAO|nr:hypothetical protein GRFL_1602 [Christiangramia flava JLT2011]OSS40887.1 hypothetical protein C723_0296 [Christiangramia flava JLT2011]